MPFVDYKAFGVKYPAGCMNKNIQQLQELDAFHCLLAGSTERANAVRKRVADLPEDFLQWLEVCDGGMLFDTTMLTTKSYDSELDLVFETYSDFCNAELRRSAGLPDEWFVFAVAVHSDLYFFDMDKKGGHVYQWDVEEQTIYAEWLSFEDWLSEQIHEAGELIADKSMKPNLMKMELIDNE